MSARDRERDAERGNRYFLPGDGIAREVIQADICRYLGNNALVKPGDYYGRTGFWVTAYRALTSDMIADLKADSQRWQDERREAGRSRGNAPVPYNTSRTHEYRQYYGPTATEDAQLIQPTPAPPGDGRAGPSGGADYPQTGHQHGYSTAPAYAGAEGQAPGYSFAPGADYDSYGPSAHQPRTTQNIPGHPGAHPGSAGYDASGHPQESYPPSAQRPGQYYPASMQPPRYPGDRDPYGRGGQDPYSR
ncbi:MAG: hypothetical protein M1832_005708 [Thelocarpon impressellum]|nr:MAG: hypothetical protein M1832_005708 [Thelocarpon impressellum]